MCGIIGINSNKPVSATIINSLKKLEYRGYDSAGIATLSSGIINEIKSEGRVDNLEYCWLPSYYSQVTACCFSLGLHESHKNINLRQDSLSIAKLNHLKLERVSDVKREESVTCDCKCTRGPKRSLPVQPKISPKL